jgi:Flp pilus assembly protein TadG
MPGLDRRDERGSAVAEFTLVSVLLVVLVLGIAQVGLAIHVRNTLVACAAEGARLAANADRGLADGAARTRQLIATALSPRLAQDVVATTRTGPAGPEVQVQVTARLPLVGLAGPARTLTVAAHAVEEVP